MKTQTIVLIVIGVVIISGGSFFAGTKYQQSKGSNSQFGGLAAGGNRAGRTGQAGGTGQNTRVGYRPVNGEIITVNGKGMSVKIQDGSTKLVLFTDKTPISKATTGVTTDLQPGTTVLVFGQDNSDGTVTAQNIQLNPIAGAMGTGRGMMNVSGTPAPQGQ